VTDEPKRPAGAAAAAGAAESAVREAPRSDASRDSPSERGDEGGDERDDELDDAIVARVSDYLDGALSPAERSEVAGRIARDPLWQRAHAELAETRSYLSGMGRPPAPPSFTENVAETIHLRSAGRLFGRRTLGDRVPFGALLAVSLAAIALIAYVLWASSTGSLKVDPDRAPAPAGSAALAPP
jgi:anti-sigma factor RsiW